MSGILDKKAVGSESGDAAKDIFQGYLQTSPGMVLNHTPVAAPTAQARPAAPSPSGPAGSGGTLSTSMGGGTATAHGTGAPVVAEYEVFKNGRNALAFFFYRQSVLDKSEEKGPFWFSIKGNNIKAGTEANHTVFEGVSPAILETAKKRGVIMLVEFENQQPFRCTPCYLSDSI